ncbi:MAG: hypothetical protein HY326_06940 [Chloroflexi bacterium]|nr:hypothetical protein [Chloroflexota bacterium]
MQSVPLSVVVMSEDAQERQSLGRLLRNLPGVELLAEVDLICQMGKQAGHLDAQCVVLDIDRYGRAGLLSLMQARATFPNARIILLTRSIIPRFCEFLKASGASYCIDKDDPSGDVRVINALQAIGGNDRTGWHYTLCRPNPSHMLPN